MNATDHRRARFALTAATLAAGTVLLGACSASFGNPTDAGRYSDRLEAIRTEAARSTGAPVAMVAYTDSDVVLDLVDSPLNALARSEQERRARQVAVQVARGLPDGMAVDEVAVTLSGRSGNDVVSISRAITSFTFDVDTL